MANLRKHDLILALILLAGCAFEASMHYTLLAVVGFGAGAFFAGRFSK